MFFVRKAYDWVLHWAYTPYGGYALFVISFAESSFFPIPPDILLIALCLSRREGSLFYGAVCSFGSVLGGILGYVIGLVLWSSVGYLFFTYVPGFTSEAFESIRASYEEYSFWVVFTAGFTPVPYKLITVSAGVFSINFPIFVIASFISRSGRFFLLAVLIFYFGDSINRFIDRYFNLLTVAFLVLLIGFYFVFKFL